MKRCLFLIAAFVFAQCALAGYMPDEANTVQIFEKRSPYVAYVYRLQKVMNYSRDVFEVPSGTGSGFVWDDKGHIVTNFHVVANANDIAVALNDAKTHHAKVVGVDPASDIAVLQVSPEVIQKNIPHFERLQIANSDEIKVGQTAIAIGNPFGLARTMTAGIVSALSRRVPGYTPGLSHHNMIQTDASVNQGNSGGPLLDSQGRLMGMNTAIYSRSGGSIGIGFAVPSNEIKRSVDQIINHGRVIQPSIGITRMEDYIARQIGVKGVIVDKVLAGTPAERAGLRGTGRNQYGQIILGDVIVGINNKPIRNFDDLYNTLRKFKIGEVIDITVLRSGRKEKFNIKTFDYGG